MNNSHFHVTSKQPPLLRLAHPAAAGGCWRRTAAVGCPLFFSITFLDLKFFCTPLPFEIALWFLHGFRWPVHALERQHPHMWSDLHWDLAGPLRLDALSRSITVIAGLLLGWRLGHDRLAKSTPRPGPPGVLPGVWLLSVPLDTRRCWSM
jgi:hypothetical protein